MRWKRPTSVWLGWLEHIVATFGAMRLLGTVLRRRPRGASHASPTNGGAAAAQPPDKPVGDTGLYERVPASQRWSGDRSPRRVRFWRWLIGKQPPAPTPSFTGLVEDPPPVGNQHKVGICCSGGGIRSAAFNLGALQELQDCERLDKAKYLAAVSGGSYIAAALCMVAKTPDPEAVGDEDEDEERGEGQGNDDSDPTLFKRGRGPFYRGSPEEQYLRNRSSYMAPGGGGMIRLGLRVSLGLLINLALLAAALTLLAWLLALYYRQFHGVLQADSPKVKADTGTAELVAIAIVTGFALLLGVVAIFLNTKLDPAQTIAETVMIRLLGLALIGLLVAVALPALVAFLRNRDWGLPTTAEARQRAAAVGGGGFSAVLAGVLLELRSKMSAGKVQEAAAWYQKLAAPIRRALAQLVAWLVGPFLLGAILVGALLAMVSSNHISWMVIVGAALIFSAFWFAGDVTTWSLHPFYRRRLCTAFALKRVAADGADPAGRGKAVERDYRKPLLLSRSGVKPGPGPSKAWPTLVVCAAANVSDPGVTPPGRSVTSFTFSPVAMGGPLVGGESTAEFEKHIRKARRRNFTLPAAVAMSGAAVSPSMGKETRRSIRFLLGLANVRLGVWVPNPRRRDRWVESSKGVRTRINSRRTYERSRVKGVEGDTFQRTVSAPRCGPMYLVKEMLGLNSVNDPFLYVTDGGHYENLGLVELLRRGCTEVFCFDASGGVALEALGDAIALARSELGVEIDQLDVSKLEEDKAGLAERCCARGRIRFPDGQQGVLIYAHNVVTKEAPYDVQALRMRDDAFPHHSTFDQLFTDEKFEAYRELGAHAGRAAIAEAKKVGDKVGPADRTEQPELVPA